MTCGQHPIGTPLFVAVAVVLVVLLLVLAALFLQFGKRNPGWRIELEKSSVKAPADPQTGSPISTKLLIMINKNTV